MISYLQIVIRIAVFASPWFSCFIASSREMIFAYPSRRQVLCLWS
jgi:hypothetical protein